MAYGFKADPAPQCSDRDRRIIEKFASEHVLADTALAQNITGAPISLRIGRDQYFKFACVGQEKTLEGELVARGSVLGWIVGGASKTADVRRPEFVRANVHCCVVSVTRGAKELERLWSLEAIGIEKEESSPHSADEQNAVHQFLDTLSYDGSQYTVAVPKKPGMADLPCNFQAALDRLQHRLRGLRRKPDDYARYHQEITGRGVSAEYHAFRAPSDTTSLLHATSQRDYKGRLRGEVANSVRLFLRRPRMQITQFVLASRTKSQLRYRQGPPQLPSSRRCWLRGHSPCLSLHQRH